MTVSERSLELSVTGSSFRLRDNRTWCRVSSHLISVSVSVSVSVVLV